MPSQTSTGSGLGRAPLRIAGLYASFGLLWIWLSDWALIWLGYTETYPLLASAIKGTIFVSMTAMLLHWLVKREVAVAQRSETLLRAVVEGTTDAVFVKDCDGRYLLANEATASFIGRPVDEVLGRDDRELFPATDAERIIANDRATMAGGKVVNLEETITSAGAKRTYHATKAPLRDATGRVSGLIGVARDMTERKAIEDAQRVSEEQYRELANAIPQIVWTASPDGAVTHLNSKTVEYTGIAETDLTGWSWQSVIHSDDVSHAVSEWSLALRNGVPRTFEMRIRRTDGEYRWHIARQLPLRNAAGEIESWVGTCTDVDDLKQTKSTLRETEIRLQQAQRIARLGSWSWDPKTNWVSWSDAEFELFGLKPGSIQPSFEAFLALLHPDDRGIAFKRVEVMMAGCSEFANDMRIIRPDGQCIWIHSRARATRDTDQGIILVEGTDQDITDMVLAKQQLQAERDRFEKLMEAVPVAICSFQLAPDGRVTMPYASPRIETIYGISPAALARDASGIFATIHPDDVEHAHASVAESSKSMTLWRSEFRVHSPVLGEIWIEGCSAPVRLSDGSVLWHGYVNDVTARKQVDDALRASERRLRLALEAAGSIAFTWHIPHDAVTRYFSNEPALPVTAERLGTLNDVRKHVHPDDLPEFDSRLSACLASGAEYRNEFRVVRPDGAIVTLEEYGYLDRAADGSPLCLTGISIDITERQRLQSQFNQAQKMEAVGRLAGGIAHDFNNLLTIISGYCELLMMSDIPVGDTRRESIATIRDAGERAARLTQQLLAFSRKAVIEPKLIDLNELVSDSAKLLRRLIGEDISMAVLTAPKPITIKADPGQLEQVIMNLVVNARDAMPTGGRLTIETSTVLSTEGSGAELACLSISDTGQGMSDEVKEKIFEPFFTTKGVGKGTGLGLAVVHGVVTQNGGTISIESKISVGTTFQILLPLIMAPPSKTVVDSTRYASRGTETVLLVEDDKAVRRITRIALQSQGYTVLEASGGAAALEQVETYPGEIHLLISDIVMPEMGGRQLLDAVRKHRPGLRVLFMSGYTDDAVLLDRGVEAADAFIQKPFTPLSLTRKVREVIDTPRS